MTIQEALAYQHNSASSPLARLDCEVLLAHSLKKTRTYLKTWPEKSVPDNALSAYLALLQRRTDGEPVAYLVGTREFWSLDLAVNDNTLIPRPETEHLVEAALSKIPPNQTQHILDLGTGTGAIAIAIAYERPLCTVTAVDCSPKALHLAQHNAQKHNLHNLQYQHSDWLTQIQGLYDVIISNPPYIASNDPHLKQGDIRFEPRLALVSGTDGMHALRAIIHSAHAHLHPGAYLILEHGFDQQAKVIHTLNKHGYVQIQGLQDDQGHARLVVAQTMCSESCAK